MKKCLLIFLIVIVFPVLASHIVGGEFELLHISGNTYQLNLIIYFDKINGSPGAKDLDVTATIFRKRDNLLISSVLLPLKTEEDVGYTQPECSHGEIQTSKLTYSALLTLLPEEFDDPGGYYVSWERCCRNYQITNIYSEQPPVGNPTYPFSAGQTFYLEFPAVVKDGVPFYNSSPRLFPPLNDYACPGKPYYVNFAGVDDDNDSLVYTLVEPLSTKTVDALPPIAPAPYPTVRWKPGYSLNNIMNGVPDLNITYDGFLSATPTLQGLYVFAVKVEQYRDDIKIGESRRDFQMLVVDGCQPSFAPVIQGLKAGDPTLHANTMSVSFANTVPDGNRCIQVQISDMDSESPLNFYKENITIRVIPLNFNKKTDISAILPAVRNAVLDSGSVATFSICFPQCPYINGPYVIGVIAFDDACSLPLSDTLQVTVDVQPPPNTPPHFTSPNPITAQIDEGDSASWNFTIVDNEGNDMDLFVLTDGFVLADAGMSVTYDKQPGLITGKIHWDAYCDIYNFTQRTSFQIRLLVNDNDQCNLDSPVSAFYNLSVRLPGVADPIIDTDLTPSIHEHLVGGLVRRVGESLSFQATGTQADGDFIILRNIDGLGGVTSNISFLPDSANNSVSSHFQWDIKCSGVNLAKVDTFQFQFVLYDKANKCRILKTDTVTVKLKVLPPLNYKPDLVIQSLTASQIVDDNLNITFGESINLGVYGSDADVSPTQDTLTLQLLEATGTVPPEGYHFKDSIGVGSVQSPFTWTPECSIFKHAVYENDYQFKFSLTDNRCFNVKGDTVTLHLKIKDVESKSEEFLPYNVITPNGDGCNDYFAVEGIDPMSEGAGGCGAIDDPDKFVSLPADNCAGSFQYVKIMNRWGKEVFQSSDRKFRWYAQNEAAGVYYYYIKFGNHEYKGALSVRP